MIPVIDGDRHNGTYAVLCIDFDNTDMERHHLPYLVPSPLFEKPIAIRPIFATQMGSC